MDRFVLLLSALLTGCGYEIALEGTQDQIAELTARIDALEANSLHEYDRRVQLDGRIAAIESAASQPATGPATSAGNSGSWIAWQIQIGGSLGGGYLPPQPLFAYDDHANCLQAMQSNIDKFDGDRESLTYVQARGHSAYTYRLTCLPLGVDPRTS